MAPPASAGGAAPLPIPTPPRGRLTNRKVFHAKVPTPTASTDMGATRFFGHPVSSAVTAHRIVTFHPCSILCERNSNKQGGKRCVTSYVHLTHHSLIAISRGGASSRRWRRARARRRSPRAAAAQPRRIRRSPQRPRALPPPRRPDRHHPRAPRPQPPVPDVQDRPARGVCEDRRDDVPDGVDARGRLDRAQCAIVVD